MEKVESVLFMTEKEIYNKALSKWGSHSQIMMLFEEMGELMQIISKSDRKNCNIKKEELISEIADVEIMLGQMKILFEIEPINFKQIKNKKLQKLQNYLIEKNV